MREKMEISNELFQAIIDSLPVHLYWADKNTRIIGANLLQARNFGDQEVQGCIGKNSYDFAKQLGWSKEFADDLHQEHLRVIKTGQGTEKEYTGILADDKEHTFLSQKYPLRVRGEIVGLVGISVDITERKNVEKALEITKEKAEGLDLKNQFIKNMEHDLRTPSSGVVQMIHMLEERETDPEKRELLSHVGRASKQLLELLNGILEFDKVSHQTGPVLFNKFDFRELVSNVIDIEYPAARSKNLELIFKCSNDVPEIIVGDNTRLYRILLNLVSNAVKFTPKGFVKVITQIAEQPSEKALLLKFIIQDTGIGIPADKQDVIYERFTRCVSSNQGHYSGSGLGLCIVRQLINDLGGEIEVESELGKGTTFTCLLPFELPLIDVYKAKKSLEREETKEKLTTKKRDDLIKVLLVEDDLLAQKVTSSLLQAACQCHVDLAKTGEEAINAVQPKQYDLIFMDLGLPDT